MKLNKQLTLSGVIEMKYILLRIYTIPINLIIDLLNIISSKLDDHIIKIWYKYFEKIDSEKINGN